MAAPAPVPQVSLRRAAHRGGMADNPEKLVLSSPFVMTLMEAAVALGIGRTTAYRLARADRFPLTLIRVGKQYRVSRRSLQDMLADDDLGPSGWPGAARGTRQRGSAGTER